MPSAHAWRTPESSAARSESNQTTGSAYGTPVAAQSIGGRGADP